MAEFDSTIISSADIPWDERLRETIKLTSPSGNTYIARWSGPSSRSVSNKTATFEYPDVPGGTVQDLRAGIKTINTDVLFEGARNDIYADLFVDELVNNKGEWTVEHPVKGPLKCIWISTEEGIDPTGSGNITVVSVPWYIIDPTSKKDTPAKAQADAIAAATRSNASAAAQFASVAKQDTPGTKQSVITSIGKTLTEIGQTLAAVKNATIIDPRVTGILTSINNLLSEDTLDFSGLAGQTQAVTQIFGLGASDAPSAVAMYTNYVTNKLTDLPDMATEDGISQAASTEMSATAGLVAACQSSLIGGLTSRQQAITLANNLADLFDYATGALDSVSEIYTDSPIDKRYFSQSSSYADMLIAFKEAIRFLLSSIYGLPAERYITLKEDKLTAQIAHDEYGNIGNDQSETFFLDVLLATNELMDDDIYFLKRGRQVLIYSQ